MSKERPIKNLEDLETFVKEHMDFASSRQVGDEFYKGVNSSYVNVYNAIKELKRNQVTPLLQALSDGDE